MNKSTNEKKEKKINVSNHLEPYVLVVTGRTPMQKGRGCSLESLKQGGKRPGGETGSPLLGQCVIRRRTGTSAPSALPVKLMAAKNLLLTNRK